MSAEITDKRFVMRPSPTLKDMSEEEYARAWLNGEVEEQFGKGYTRPSLEDVMNVLREEPNLAERFIRRNIDLRHSHDVVYLEEVRDGYEIYVTDHARKVDTEHFEDMWSALAKYFQYLGLR